MTFSRKTLIGRSPPTRAGPVPPGRYRGVVRPIP